MYFLLFFLKLYYLKFAPKLSERNTMSVEKESSVEEVSKEVLQAEEYKNQANEYFKSAYEDFINAFFYRPTSSRIDGSDLPVTFFNFPHHISF